MPIERQTRMERLGDEIAQLAAHINAATARWLGLLAEFDDGGGWGDGGYKSCAHWLSWRCGIATGTARDHVRVANALRRRPLIAAAFERGEISYSKVRALMRLDDDFSEELMLIYAHHASASQIEMIVRGCRRCVSVEQGAARQFAEREFRWAYDDDGAVVFKGRLPAELGAVVVRAIEAARDELGRPPAEATEGLPWQLAEAAQSPGARKADALVAVAQSALAEKASSADVYQVVLHVDAEALAAPAPAAPPLAANAAGASTTQPGRCTLEDGEPLATAAARRLTCDASIARVLERDGKTIAFGRKTRTIPPSLRRALRMRDQGCAFPGCNQRHHTDGHHIEHWADGGRTNLDNLVQLCRFHHRLLHEGGFSVRREHGALTFVSPSGATIPQAPRQPRGDCRQVTTGANRPADSPTPWTLHPKDTNPQAELAWSVQALLESRQPAPT